MSTSPWLWLALAYWTMAWLTWGFELPIGKAISEMWTNCIRLLVKPLRLRSSRN